MRIVFFGTPEFALPSLQRLLGHSEFEVVAVVTQPDRRRGRGKAQGAPPVKQVATRANLPVWQPTRLRKDPEVLDKLDQCHADAFVVVAYGQLLPPAVLEMPRLGCINGHGSLLPAYRGAAPIQRALVAGETLTGVTTMLMDEGMDTGDMLLTVERPIELLDHAETVATDLAMLTADLLVDTLIGLDRATIDPVAQDDNVASYAPLIDKQEFGLDWGLSALALHNRIRGFYPYCTTEFRGKPLKVMGTAPLGPAYWSQLPFEFSVVEHDWPNLSKQLNCGDCEPGTVVGILKNIGPVIQTGSGLLLLRQVIPAGKRPQSGWDFANGMHLQVGDRLG